MNNKIKNASKILIAIIAFIFIAYGYSPQVFTGKVVNQSDISSWQGMANEIVTYNNAHPNDKTLWTNSMFGGMPATTISVIYEGDYTNPIYQFLFMGERPASYLFISLIGGFLLFMAFGVNIWLATLGAIAISFCSYNMQIIQVGHNTKMIAIAFMPWVLAAVVYAYRKCPLWGGLFFAFALSFQIKANHPQITYYLAIIIIGYGIWQLCAALKDKTFPKFLRTSAILLVAGLIGIATNINHLWPTYEYAQHTMRGGSELSATTQTNETTQTGKKTRSGLDLKYATQWCYSIDETANLLIPNFCGGSSGGALDKNSHTYKALKQEGYQGAEQVIKQLPLYWGSQPFTAGPMYMGAISIFLFVLGFFVLKGGLKWWIGSVSLLALMLGWGSHFMPISEFFFNWAPMYNKFRTVSMILVILQILIPIMAVLTVNELLFGNNTADGNTIITQPNTKQVRRGFYWALGLTAGFSLIFAIIPSLAGTFISGNDDQMPNALLKPLAQDRMALLQNDAIRTIIFILLAACTLWFAYIKKIKSKYAAITLTVLVLIDLWGVDKRYLNDSHFVTQREFKTALNLRQVDKLILEDKDPNYRVLDISVNTFNDAYVSYHHKTIGGYSPAKLQRYQDLIDYNISVEMGAISQELSGAQTLEDAQTALTYHPVLSMLNTKYIVINENVPPLVNKYALGNAWFINEIITVNNANEEITKLKTIDPAHQAVVSKEFSNIITLAKPSTTLQDSTANISLTSYAPNKLEYSYNSTIPQTALFSEVYYNPGWKATIDGQEAPIFRANWILRGLQLPAGKHNIVFTFEPLSFSKGATYSRIASVLLIVLLLGGLTVMYIRNRKKDGKQNL
ncbi:MAG: YfhO family protein [Bacteroidales bacterium]